jgi:hypothetical protein
MDELKTLVEVVANLPSLTVWVLAGFLLYKLATLASMYALLQLVVVKIHDYKTRPPAPVPPTQMVFGRAFIDEGVEMALRAQVERLKTNSTYIHSSDVLKLAKAIDHINKI